METSAHNEMRIAYLERNMGGGVDLENKLELVSHYNNMVKFSDEQKLLGFSESAEYGKHLASALWEQYEFIVANQVEEFN